MSDKNRAPHRDRAAVDHAAGTLILIGGATTPGGAALAEFVRLSRAQDDGRVVALTTASGDPRAAASQWEHDLRAAGCRTVDIPLVITREHAADPRVAETIRRADGIFLGGGDQVKLMSILGGSLAEEAIRDAYVRGVAIGGSSAGAAALSKTTLAGNEVDERGNLVEQYIGPGLGLLRHQALIDTHFSQRRRLYRLFVALAEFPDLLGLGLDENTALVVTGDLGRVIGVGGVTFVDGQTVSYSNAAKLRDGQPLTISAMRVGVIGAGHTFDLAKRELVP